MNDPKIQLDRRYLYENTYKFLISIEQIDIYQSLSFFKQSSIFPSLFYLSPYCEYNDLLFRINSTISETIRSYDGI